MNFLLGRLFGVKKEQVSGQFRVLRNEKPYDFCSLICVWKLWMVGVELSNF
jgi:hypothetical protein